MVEMQSARLKRAGIVRCLLEARDFSHVRLHKVGLNPGKIHHCALSEGKTVASQFDIVFCAKNFTNMFKDAEKKGTKVIIGANREIDEIAMYTIEA